MKTETLDEGQCMYWLLLEGLQSYSLTLQYRVKFQYSAIHVNISMNMRLRSENIKLTELA